MAMILVTWYCDRGQQHDFFSPLLMQKRFFEMAMPMTTVIGMLDQNQRESAVGVVGLLPDYFCKQLKS